MHDPTLVRIEQVEIDWNASCRYAGVADWLISEAIDRVEDTVYEAEAGLGSAIMAQMIKELSDGL